MLAELSDFKHAQCSLINNCLILRTVSFSWDEGGGVGMVVVELLLLMIVSPRFQCMNIDNQLDETV